MVLTEHKKPYRFMSGKSPLLISIPHAGMNLLPGMQAQLSEVARQLPDTDWHVGQLYSWAQLQGVSILQAEYSRYVVDLNRPANDEKLYQTRTTGLFPVQTFAGDAVWLKNVNKTFTKAWILENIWQAYHRKLATELQKIKQHYGYALLLDAHSIAAVVPGLFSGTLPDLNLGSFGRASAAPGLIDAAYRALETDHYTRVLDGRFKGGFITRQYGQPEQQIHALQLELAQSIYLQDPPHSPLQGRPEIDANKLALLEKTLKQLVQALLDWQAPGAGS